MSPAVMQRATGQAGAHGAAAAHSQHGFVTGIVAPPEWAFIAKSKPLLTYYRDACDTQK